VGPILDMVAVSHDVDGALYEEMGCSMNSCVVHLFTMPARTRRFASSIVPLRVYKACDHPSVQPTFSRMISHHLPASFPTWLKRKRDRETDLEIGGNC
jgi:hypothetical protein